MNILIVENLRNLSTKYEIQFSMKIRSVIKLLYSIYIYLMIAFDHVDSKQFKVFWFPADWPFYIKNLLAL